MNESDELQRKQKELLEMQIRFAKRDYEIEPWKLILTTIGTTAAVILALLALATFILIQLVK